MAPETWESLPHHTQLRSSVHHSLEHDNMQAGVVLEKQPSGLHLADHRKSTIALYYVNFDPGLSQ